VQDPDLDVTPYEARELLGHRDEFAASTRHGTEGRFDVHVLQVRRADPHRHLGVAHGANDLVVVTSVEDEIHAGGAPLL